MRLLIPDGNESGAGSGRDHLLHGLTGTTVLGSPDRTDEERG
jgi:hypothetical protein